MDPWGTPEVTGSYSDAHPSKVTFCSLLVRQSINHARRLPLNPKVFSLAISGSCGTKSKALLRSKYMTSVCDFESKMLLIRENTVRS